MTNDAMNNDQWNIEGNKSELRMNGETTLALRVRPGAHHTKVTGVMDDGVIKIDIAAIAEDGKANEELVRFIAKEFGVPRASVQIIGGIATRRKIVRVTL